MMMIDATVQYGTATEYERRYEYLCPLRVLRITYCLILLWILYGNMVDFSFIVSLYVSDLLNKTIP